MRNYLIKKKNVIDVLLPVIILFIIVYSYIKTINLKP